MEELFSWQSLATLAGATLAVVLVTNALRLAFGFEARWLALAVAFVVQLLVWWFVSDQNIDDLVLALVNAFVVYAAATGGNEIVSALRRPQVVRYMEENRQFWSSWWPK